MIFLFFLSWPILSNEVKVASTSPSSDIVVSSSPKLANPLDLKSLYTCVLKSSKVNKVNIISFCSWFIGKELEPNDSPSGPSSAKPALPPGVKDVRVKALTIAPVLVSILSKKGNNPSLSTKKLSCSFNPDKGLPGGGKILVIPLVVPNDLSWKVFLDFIIKYWSLNLFLKLRGKKKVASMSLIYSLVFTKDLFLLIWFPKPFCTFSLFSSKILV